MSLLILDTFFYAVLSTFELNMLKCIIFMTRRILNVNRTFWFGCDLEHIS